MDFDVLHRPESVLDAPLQPSQRLPLFRQRFRMQSDDDLAGEDIKVVGKMAELIASKMEGA